MRTVLFVLGVLLVGCADAHRGAPAAPESPLVGAWARPASAPHACSSLLLFAADGGYEQHQACNGGPLQLFYAGAWHVDGDTLTVEPASYCDGRDAAGDGWQAPFKLDAGGLELSGLRYGWHDAPIDSEGCK